VLPPLSVTVDISIVQDTAKVDVTQVFWNASVSSIKEASFNFPLPAGCTVTDFSCRIGTSRVITGSIKPREEAREAFRHHIYNHETTAALLEQGTPEIFTTTLGNVAPNTKVQAHLTFIALLKHHFADTKGVTTLTIPTYIAPRYGVPPKEYDKTATSDVAHGLVIEVEIIESERISAVESPSHNIVVERRQGTRNADSFADLAGDGNRRNTETAFVKLESGSMLLDKDFVLDIVTTPSGGTEGAQAWLEEHPILQNHKALMLTLPAGLMTNSEIQTQKTEILFLADLSGSMSDKIPSLKSAMQFFLKGIPENRKFNIWCFGTERKPWQQRSVEYSEITLNSALAWVASEFRADMGGTEILPAIQAVVAARDQSLTNDIIVLTDGETWHLDQTLEYIQQTRVRTEGRVRFFALGIGRGVSHALVDGIAKAGGGYAEVVQEASQGGWEDRVVSIAKAALMSQHIGPLRLEVETRDEYGSTRSSHLQDHKCIQTSTDVPIGTSLIDSKRSPADFSSLNPFDRSRSYFLFNTVGPSKIENVVIQATVDRETKSFVVPVITLEKKDSTLHKLGARSMLDDLERGNSHIHLGPNRPYPRTREEVNMVRKEAEKIACTWSLVSKWTSFFLSEDPSTVTDDSIDGVIRVDNGPGDDLLRPLMTLQQETNLTEPVGMVGELQSLFRSDPPWLAIGGVPLHPPARARPLHLPNRAIPSASYPLHPPTEGPPSYKSPCAQGRSLAAMDAAAMDAGTKPLESFTPTTSSASESLVDRKLSTDHRMQTSLNSGSVSDHVLSLLSMGRVPQSSDCIRYTSETDLPLSPPLVPRSSNGWMAKCGWTARTAKCAPTERGSFQFSMGPEVRRPSLRQPQPQGGTLMGRMTEREFIRALLKYQKHDGCIRFSNAVLAEGLLGAEISRALTDLKLRNSSWSEEQLWTSAVCILLERDFQSCAALWQLMALKGKTYLGKFENSEELLRDVEEALEGLKVPIHREQEAQVGETTDEEEEEEDDETEGTES
jgi:hypothetical protein